MEANEVNMPRLRWNEVSWYTHNQLSVMESKS